MFPANSFSLFILKCRQSVKNVLKIKYLEAIWYVSIFVEFSGCVIEDK